MTYKLPFETRPVQRLLRGANPVSLNCPMQVVDFSLPAPKTPKKRGAKDIKKDEVVSIAVLYSSSGTVHVFRLVDYAQIARWIDETIEIDR